MIKPPNVFYLSKSDNPPYYNAGKELHTVEYDRGWVEYLLQTSDLYFMKMSDSLIDLYRPTTVEWIRLAWIGRDEKRLSLLKYLASHRISQPFDLPIFNNWRQPSILTCGNTRFSAEVLCGTGPGQIPVFFLTEKGCRPPTLAEATSITSTAQAEEISNITSIDYRLTFSQTAVPHVITSTLRNSMFDTNEAHSNFTDGKFIVDFWEKFTQDNRINITITCDEKSKQLIKFDTKIWNVKFQTNPISGFSFGQILGKFNQPDNDQLNLYVYSINTSFDLLYLIPWTTTNSVWYHTINKQVHLVDTSRGAATACWPIVAMGNFVK
jgi:hypothetical protein